MAKFTSNSAPKGGKSVSTPKGNATKLERGFTAQAPSKNPQDRPPKLSKGVSNDFFRGAARSAVMPPPTGDTQEPRMSKFTGKKGLSKGRPR